VSTAEEAERDRNRAACVDVLCVTEPYERFVL
jgi:hypothetical protein